jgi:hypothetical protein
MAPMAEIAYAKLAVLAAGRTRTQGGVVAPVLAGMLKVHRAALCYFRTATRYCKFSEFVLRQSPTASEGPT